MYDPIYKETLRDKKTSTIDESMMYKSFQTTNKFLSGYKKKIPEYSIYHPNKNNLVLPPIQKNKKQSSIEKRKDVIDEADDESGNNSGSKSGSGDDESGSGNGDSGSDEHDKESNKESNKESEN